MRAYVGRASRNRPGPLGLLTSARWLAWTPPVEVREHCSKPHRNFTEVFDAWVQGYTQFYQLLLYRGWFVEINGLLYTYEMLIGAVFRREQASLWLIFFTRKG